VLVLCEKFEMKRITKILVVNHRLQNGYILEEIIGYHQQFVFSSASTEEEALEKIIGFSPDIILIVIIADGLDGYEVCKKIREKSINRFPKIILISDQSLVEDRLKGYAAGADDFIAQPLIEEEVIAKLKVYSTLQRIEELDLFKMTALNLLYHETRTPLNGIILGSELLGEVENLPQSAKTYIETIESCGKKIQKLLEKISRYCTLKEGVTLNLKKEYIYESIQLVIASLLTKKKPVIQVHCDKSLRFFADWILLREVFSYILNNSIEYGPSSGLIQFCCEQREENVIITFSDEGRGVDLIERGNIFEGLYSPDILHHHKGAALNLAIAREIIEQHGGTITCGRGENGGALFKIILTPGK
jgi:signal transduction histidine kinase